MTADPARFRLFFKGKEQYVYIKGEADGKVNTGDYIEFYARPDISDVDSLLYTGINYLPNPYAGLYNDTVYAFLTLSGNSGNKRFAIEGDTASANYPAGNHMYTNKTFYNNVIKSYNNVLEYFEDSSDPHYTQSEGFGFEFGISPVSFPAISTNFSNMNIFQSAQEQIFVTLNYSGASKSSSVNPDHHIITLYRSSGGSPVIAKDTAFFGWQPVRQQFTINPLNVGTGTNFTMQSVDDQGVVRNSTILHYVNVFYPQTLNLGGNSTYRMYIDNSSAGGKGFYAFNNFYYTGSPSVLLYDLTNGKRITTVLANNRVRAVIPDGNGRKTCFMSSENEVIPVTNLRLANYGSTFNDPSSFNGKKNYILLYNKNLESSATQYRNYRQSAAGGGYDVVMMDVNELYEQFSYGVNKHPLAIRNFLRLMYNKNVPPQYVLLIGKGISRLDFAHEDENLIPAFGIPSSDNLYTSGLSLSTPANFYPDLPLGRIAAISNSEVNNYLDKVKEHESSPTPVNWKKRVLHFVGGNDEGILEILSQYMDEYKGVISDSLFGADVVTFKKNTTAPVQTNISDSIRNTINFGASLLNFFGHGSQQGFDQAIDDPELYSNTGRYPVILGNSCYSGDIYTWNVKSMSERFLFSRSRGSVGFIATTTYGFQYALYYYSKFLYHGLTFKKYGKGIGDAIQYATQVNAQSNDIYRNFVNMDMTLHGDPAVPLHPGIFPDYELTNKDVQFDLKTYTDSVGISIHVSNTGKGIRDSILVRTERFFPNGDSIVILKKIPTPLLTTTIKFFTAIDFNRGFGLNRFTVQADYGNRVKEYNEYNNSTTGALDLFIPGGDLYPVYPYRFAVVPRTTSITLKASTTDPFAPAIRYVIQVDTSAKFNHPFFTNIKTSTGGVLEWDIDLIFGDSTVYFWRVSRDSTSPLLSFLWRESSFQTVGTKRGWSQAHFDQFSSDKFQYVARDTKTRKLVFNNSYHSVECRTGNNPFMALPNQSWYFDKSKMDDWSCTFDGWNFAVFDTVSGMPDGVVGANYPANGLSTYSSCACKPNQVYHVYAFGKQQESAACYLDTSWKQRMEFFLNAIPQNKYVLAYTTGYRNSRYISQYPLSLINAFGTIGADIRTLDDSIAYISFGRKGMSLGQAHTLKGKYKSTVLYFNDSIRTKWHEGNIISEVIGPSYGWTSLHWMCKALESGAGDSTLIKVLGIKKNGAIDTLAQFMGKSGDVDLSSVSAASYPFVQLVAQLKDRVNKTPPQLSRWQVIYDEAPECAINPLKGFRSINDSLMEGDEVSFHFPIENLGVKNFNDSLAVTYWIEDNQAGKTNLATKFKAAPFKAGMLMVDTVRIATEKLRGQNALWIFANPVSHPRYQYEQVQFNNIARYPFNVSRDATNPLLDVTFDGVHILNGDLVSSRPEISISLKDENKFLALNDTNAFILQLQGPGQGTPQRIFFAQGLEFHPAVLPANSARVVYKPALAVDGKYTLIAQAYDRSRNASGAKDYRIQFEVINKSTITNVMNYPNPFTSSTRFVFTLTGSDVPEVFTIRIMTISGKLVREVTRTELGFLHVGRNITEYAWDGRDQFGDPLGNGVYLYNVVTRLHGESIENRGSGADRYFTKEFGKMVLMR